MAHSTLRAVRSRSWALVASHTHTHMCVVTAASIHSESAASRRRTGRTPTSGSAKRSPCEGGGYLEMHDRVRARPAITPPSRLSLSPCPLSASGGVERDNTQKKKKEKRKEKEKALRRVTAQTAHRRTGSASPITRTHTLTHPLANTLIGISSVPPSTCPSLFQSAIHTMQKDPCFSYFAPLFPPSLSLSPSPDCSSQTVCRVPALYCSSLPSPSTSPPLHLSPCVPEKRRRRREGKGREGRGGGITAGGKSSSAHASWTR